MITELKNNNITKSMLEERNCTIQDDYLKAKLSDIKLLYTEFNNEINNKYLDDDDLLSIVKDKIKM